MYTKKLVPHPFLMLVNNTNKTAIACKKPVTLQITKQVQKNCFISDAWFLSYSINHIN